MLQRRQHENKTLNAKHESEPLFYQTRNIKGDITPGSIKNRCKLKKSR